MHRIEKTYELPLASEKASRQWREFARGGGLPAGAFDFAFEPLGESRTRLSVIAEDEDDTLRRVERTVQEFRRFLGLAA
jgi:hypothetical protein